MKEMKGKAGFVLVVLVATTLAFWAGRKSAHSQRQESASSVKPSISNESAVADAAQAKRTPFEFLVQEEAITISRYTGQELTITIPSSINGLPVKRIGNGAFEAISQITRVTIPNGVISIGDGAFYQCSDLVSVALPASIKTIGKAAFRECKSLSDIRLPDALIRIGDRAFLGCARLPSLLIPEGVTTIEEFSVGDCTSLTQVVLGKGVKVIEQNAFSGCISLKAMYFLGDAPTAGYCALFNAKPVVYHLPRTRGWTESFAECHTALCEQ